MRNPEHGPSEARAFSTRNSSRVLPTDLFTTSSLSARRRLGLSTVGNPSAPTTADARLGEYRDTLRRKGIRTTLTVSWPTPQPSTLQGSLPTSSGPQPPWQIL